jgi:hypothetical protein
MRQQATRAGADWPAPALPQLLLMHILNALTDNPWIAGNTLWAHGGLVPVTNMRMPGLVKIMWRADNALGQMALTRLGTCRVHE